MDPTCWDDAIGDVVGSVTGGIVDQVADSFKKGALEALKWLLTLWVDPPGKEGSDLDKLLSPNIGNNTDPVVFMHAHTAWLVTWVAVLGLLIAAGRMAWQRRGEPFREAFSGLVTMVIAGWAGIGAVNLAVIAGNEYSTWILKESTGAVKPSDLDKVSTLFMQTPTGQAMAAAIVIIVALLAIVSSLIQMGMMMVRGAMLVLLAGALPLAAGASMTPEGRQWFRKMVGWLIAFVLYKPVAATIYAVALRAMAGNDSASELQGVILIILAVVALPALMRFVVPMVSAAGGGGSGAMAAGVVGAAAMGARMVPAMGGSGKSGPSGDQGASGGGDRGAAGAKTTGTPGPTGGGKADPSAKDKSSGGSDGGSPPQGSRPDGGQGNAGPAPTGVGAGTATGGAGATAGSGAGAGAAAAGAGAAAATGGVSAGIQGAKQAFDTGKNVAQGAASDATGDQEGPDGSG